MTTRWGYLPCDRTSCVDLGAASIADFVPWVGTTFRGATAAERPIAIELVEAAPLTASGSSARRLPFSLIFRGPPDRHFEQRSHNLEHDQLGRLALFLVPIGPGSDGNGPYYQAIFN